MDAKLISIIPAFYFFSTFGIVFVIAYRKVKMEGNIQKSTIIFAFAHKVGRQHNTTL